MSNSQKTINDHLRQVVLLYGFRLKIPVFSKDNYLCRKRLSVALPGAFYPNRVYLRRREYRQSPLAGKSVFKADDFFELAPIGSSPAAITIVFPGAIELQIHRDCDRALLGEVITQLRKAAC